MNIRRPLLAILTVLVLAVAGFAVAQTNTSDQSTTSGTMDHSMTTGQNTENAPNEPGVESVTGLVVSYQNDQLVVRTQDGERTFRVISTTVHPATMQANLPVIVHYVTETGGDRAVRVEENTHTSAADQTPGGSVSGNDQWPGAANKNSETDSGTNNAADTNTATGSTGSSYSGTTGSTGSESAYSGSTGTTTTGSSSSLDQTGSTSSTGQTGSTYDRGTTGTSTTGSMNDETNTASNADQTGYQGSSLPRTGSDLPLVGLLGLAALVAAAGIHFGRNA